MIIFTKKSAYKIVKTRFGGKMNYWEGFSKEGQEKLIFKSLDLIRENVSTYGKMNPSFIQDPEGISHLQYAKTWRWLEQENLYGKYRDIFDLAIYGVITAACEYNPEKRKPFNPKIQIQQSICDGDSNKGIKGVLRVKNWKDLSNEERETLIFRWLPLIRGKVAYYGRNTPQNRGTMQDESEDNPQQPKEKEADNTDFPSGKAQSSYTQIWGWLGKETLIKIYPDIFDLAIHGVMTAADEYEPGKGIKFYPEIYIERLILDGDRKRGIKGVMSYRSQNVKAASGANLSISQKTVNAVSKKLRQELEKEPSRYEIAEKMVDIHFPDVPSEERARLTQKIVDCLEYIEVVSLPLRSFDEITNQGFDKPLDSYGQIIDRGFNEPQTKEPTIEQIYIDQIDISKTERLDNIHKAMRTLPKEWQEAFVLSYWGGFSDQEIAEKLGVKKQKISNWLTRGRERIRLLVLEKEDKLTV